MDCKNHAGVAAVDRCVGCAEGFCENCLVEMHGQKYCGQCKYMNVKGPPVIETTAKAFIPCEEANDALKYALIGIPCVGFILQPIAISRALKARKVMREDPELTGLGKARAALIIGMVYLILFGLGLLSGLANLR